MRENVVYFGIIFAVVSAFTGVVIYRILGDMGLLLGDWPTIITLVVLIFVATGIVIAFVGVALSESKRSVGVRLQPKKTSSIHCMK